jgi:hypothetical protein
MVSPTLPVYLHTQTHFTEVEMVFTKIRKCLDHTAIRRQDEKSDSDLIGFVAYIPHLLYQLAFPYNNLVKLCFLGDNWQEEHLPPALKHFRSWNVGMRNIWANPLSFLLPPATVVNCALCLPPVLWLVMFIACSDSGVLWWKMITDLYSQDHLQMLARSTSGFMKYLPLVFLEDGWWKKKF